MHWFKLTELYEMISNYYINSATIFQLHSSHFQFSTCHQVVPHVTLLGVVSTDGLVISIKKSVAVMHA